MSDPIKPQLSPDELVAISECGSPLSRVSGDVIFRREEAGTSMFVIMSGSVDLVFDETREGKRLGAGCFFGELAMIKGNHPRSATAVVADDCKLIELARPDVLRLLEQHPAVLVSLLRRSCVYLIDSERRLVSDLERRNKELERTLDFLRRTREELDTKELQAQTDELTGIYNRRCLNTQIGRFMERAEQTGMSLALIIVDLDYFKQVNDTHGHDVGDTVLKRVSDAIRTSVRSSDLPCRIGGDEFAVLLADLPAEEAAVARLRGIHESTCRQRVEAATGIVSVSTSVGGTLFRPGEPWEDLFKRADASLYAAKAAGRSHAAWEGLVVDRLPDRRAAGG